MSAMTMSNFNPYVQDQRKSRRIGSFGLIVLLHIAFFYALSHGLLHEAARIVPEEVVSIFITTDTPPQQKTAPRIKTLPVVKMAFSVPRTVVPTDVPAPVIQVAVENTAPVAAPLVHPVVASAPVAPAPIQTVSSGVEYIRAPHPEYPPIARRMREEGKVLLRILVNEKGHPEHVEVQASSGSSRLDEAARQAATLALFKPHIEDGRAVSVYAIIPIGFYLNA